MYVLLMFNGCPDDNGCALAVNECDSPMLNNCHLNATCTDLFQGFLCTCYSGFSGDGITCSSE